MMLAWTSGMLAERSAPPAPAKCGSQSTRDRLVAGAVTNGILGHYLMRSRRWILGEDSPRSSLSCDTLPFERLANFPPEPLAALPLGLL